MTSVAGSTSYLAISGTNSNETSPVQINYAENPIIKGDTRVIYIATNPIIANTTVRASVTYSSGYNREFNNQTNSSGQASVSWTINTSSDPRTFYVVVTINGRYYPSSFQVSS